MKGGSSGICPHCRLAVRFEAVQVRRGSNVLRENLTAFQIRTPSQSEIELTVGGCPSCGLAVVGVVDRDRETRLIWPAALERPVPKEVRDLDPDIAADFKEAAAVLTLSKKASAALSRRCLQAVLVSKAGVKPTASLAAQIEEVLPKLPAELAANVDVVRNIGNFAAHPMKSQSTGTVVDVEPGEAEWLLEVLDGLFDFYYVQPSAAAAKREALNKKLQELGKPPLKAPAAEEEQVPS